MTFRLGILGGGLQGIEAACLARWAGWSSTLADSRPEAPASSLADDFRNLPLNSLAALDEAFAGCDLVLPACEDWPTLELLTRWGRARGRPVAFDPAAYQISSDKARSKELFDRVGVPAPKPYPAAGFPLIAKPVASSGSRGVTLLRDEADFRRLFPSGATAGWVVEEYCPGPSYSLEVSGRPGHHQAWLTTALEMDGIYDCRQVRSPADLRPDQEQEFRAVSLALASALGLTGLMDIEIISAPQGLKVLEIDARLPSQTPMVVYWSTGENLLVRLAQCFLPSLPAPAPKPARSRAVICEHVSVTPAGATLGGEHLMAAARPLTLTQNFAGADWALTDHQPGRPDWAATLLMVADDEAALLAKREQVLNKLGVCL